MNVNETVCEALFASPLQRSDTLTAGMVADALASTVKRLGTAGCSSSVAEEFGNHPEEAADRMRWIRTLMGDLSGRMYLPTTPPDTTASAGNDLIPVRAAA